MAEYFNQLGDQIITELPNVLSALLIFIVSLYVGKLLGNIIERILTRQKADREVTQLLVRITRWSIVVIGAITALQRFFDVTAFLTGLGILGFTVGFALQDIMQNFVAGIILLVQQPFEVDDVIETDQFLGTVLEINIRTTEMKTIDGRIVIIPNATILANPITNYTRAEFRRIELPVGVAYGSDPVKAKQAILSAIRNVPGFAGEPAPMVVFHTFSGSSIDLSAYFWIDMSKTNPLEAKDAAFELIKAELDKQGIEIPFPITTVYVHSEN